MASSTEFPSHIDAHEDDIRDYLNELRESAVTNMFGAAPYLQETFGLSKQDARAALSWWMGQH